jgi:hypothetical protein
MEKSKVALSVEEQDVVIKELKKNTNMCLVCFITEKRRTPLVVPIDTGVTVKNMRYINNFPMGIKFSPDRNYHE